MLKISRIKLFFKRKAILLSAIFFIIYRFYYVFLFFYGRKILPEPDDSYFYLREVKKIVDSKTLFYNFPENQFFPVDPLRMLPYKLFIAIIHWVTEISLEKVYILTFYLGTLLLLFVLLYFFKKIVKEKNNLAWLIFFLAFYSGSGAYHGFYWVVPSFFTLLLFFILAAKSYDSSKTISCLPFFLVLLFVSSHPIAVYILAILFFNSIYLYLFTKKNKKSILITALWMFAGLAYYLFIQIILKITKSSVLLSYDLPIDSFKNIIRGGEIFPAWLIYKNEYLKILFFHPFLVIIFILFIIVLIKYKRYKILSIFLATLTFSIFSLITQFGYRSLEYLWPITFLVIGQGIYDTSHFFKGLWKFLFWIPVIIFLIMLNIFNYIHIRYFKISNNYSVDFSCGNYLLSNVSDEEVIYYQSNTAYQIFAFTGLYAKKALLLESNAKISETGNFYIKQIFEDDNQEEKLSPIELFLTSNISRKGNIVKNNNKLNQKNFYDQKNHLEFKRNCGQFEIYKIYPE